MLERLMCVPRYNIDILFHLGHSKLLGDKQIFNINTHSRTHSLTYVGHTNKKNTNERFSHIKWVPWLLKTSNEGTNAPYLKKNMKIDPFKHSAYDGWITTTTIKNTKTKCPNRNETHFNATNGSTTAKKNIRTTFIFYYKHDIFELLGSIFVLDIFFYIEYIEYMRALCVRARSNGIRNVPFFFEAFNNFSLRICCFCLLPAKWQQ